MRFRVPIIYTALALICLSVFTTIGRAGEIVKFKLFDGETTEGKLSLPANAASVKLLVIYIHGTGPSTYDKRRGTGANAFNYFDYFADEFNRRGIAFFTYNKRGVTPAPDAPYETIDREKFRKAVPSIEVRDIGTFIATLRSDKRLNKAKIVLLGWSEGTVLAAMTAENKQNRIDALFLNGYVHDNMSEVIKWQNTGGSSMASLRPIFDKDKNGSISREEYESEEKTPASFRRGSFGDAKFELLDVTKDGRIDAADFAMINAARYKAILDAIDKGDEDWIWTNYFHVSIAWLREHMALEANKDRLLRLNLPIYIFHGEDDANCPVEGVYDLRKRFDAAKKKNLHEFVFAGHNHDLNFADWLTKKEMSEGLKKMFSVADLLDL